MHLIRQNWVGLVKSVYWLCWAAVQKFAASWGLIRLLLVFAKIINIKLWKYICDLFSYLFVMCTCLLYRICFLCTPNLRHKAHDFYIKESNSIILFINMAAMLLLLKPHTLFHSKWILRETSLREKMWTFCIKNNEKSWI